MNDIQLYNIVSAIFRNAIHDYLYGDDELKKQAEEFLKDNGYYRYFNINIEYLFNNIKHLKEREEK